MGILVIQYVILKCCILSLSVQFTLIKASKASTGFPGSSAGKESTCNAGDMGSISGLGRSPGRGHDNHSSILTWRNPHGQRSLAGYSPWDCKQSDTTEWLSRASMHHQFNGHEFGQTLGDGEGLEGWTCCSLWGCKESDMSWRLNNDNKASTLS